MNPEDPRHGTTAGYQAETNANLPHCRPCMDARAVYQRHREYDNALGRPRKMPAIGARRRVRALQRLGWSLTMIAHEAGRLPVEWKPIAAVPASRQRNPARPGSSRPRICRWDRRKGGGCVTTTITLDPPAAFINANDRHHHHAKAKLTKAWRQAAETAVGFDPYYYERAHITVSYRFPTNHRREVANLQPTAKAIVDGLVDARRVGARHGIYAGLDPLERKQIARGAA